MTADAAAIHRVMATHATSFTLAARLLPPRVRDRTVALYAWCRACDDAIDLAPPETHAATLAALERELASIHAGEPQRRPHAAAFQEAMRACAIPVTYPTELLAGLRMDVEQSTYGTTGELLRYAYRVAGTVGLMMTHIVGVTDARALPHAAHLGIAMQLTNICRDVAEDWSRGRLYLPADLLGPAAVAALHPGRGVALPGGHEVALAGAVQRLLTLAEAYYASGDRGIAYLDWRAAASVRAARALYSAIGDILARRGYDVLAGRAVVPRRRKLRLAGGAVLQATRDWIARRAAHHATAPPDAVLGADAAISLGGAVP